MDLPMLNGLSLFSGIGGIDLALREYVRPIAYCEIEPYCQAVLLSRMAEGSLESSPIWDDIKSLEGDKFKVRCDIIFGGFPCQDISVAGNGKGLAGERSGLFFEIVRLAKEIKPKFIFLENVPAICSRGGERVVAEITTMGYDCRWCVISAASVGALHRRERFFLLAHAKHDGASSSENRGSVRECPSPGKEQGQQAESIGETERTGSISSDVADTNSTTGGGDLRKLSETDAEFKESEKSRQDKTSKLINGSSDVADSRSERLEGFRQRTSSTVQKQPESSGCGNDGDTDSITGEQADTSTESNQGERNTRRGSTRQCWPFESRDDWQETVSRMGKCVDGVSAKLDYNTQRLRALGNAVVPCQVKEAFEILMGLK